MDGMEEKTADFKKIFVINNKTAEQYLIHLEFLEKERQPYVDFCEEMAPYVLPKREVDDVEKRHKTVGKVAYSSVPIQACGKFAEGLVGYAVTPQAKWFKISIPFDDLDDNYEVKQWKELVEKQIYTQFTRSNFYDEVIEFYKDLGAFGTAYMFIEEMMQERKIRFEAIHYKQMCIDENAWGMVDTVYRRFTLTPKQAAERFGLENLSTNLQAIVKENKVVESREFVHVVEPRINRDKSKLSNKSKKYLSVYIEIGEKHFISESGYDTLPYIVLRASKNSGEKYGRAPSAAARADILTLNQVAKDNLTLSHRNADPPIQIRGEFKRKIKMSPGYHNYTDRPANDITPLGPFGNYYIGKDKEMQLADDINKAFYVDFFLMIASADKGMTATEVYEKQGEKAALLGSIMNRLGSEQLDPTIDRMFNIEFNAGRLPPIPEALQDIPGAEMSIDYIGPLAQQQQKHFKVRGIQASLQAVLPLVELDPSILDVIDFTKLTKELLNGNGMPSSVMNDDEVIKKLREGRQQQQEAAQAQEQAAQTLDTMTKPGAQKAPEDGSMVTQIQESALAAQGEKIGR